MKTFLMRIMVLYIAIPLAAFSLDEQFIEACKVGNLSKAEELLTSFSTRVCYTETLLCILLLKKVLLY